MKHNMSVLDRAIRVIIAVIIFTLYLKNNIHGTPGIALVILAIVFTFTSFVNYCPTYSFLGLRRWERKDEIKRG